MSSYRGETLKGDDAIARVHTLAGSFFERHVHDTETYGRLESEGSYLAEVVELHTTLHDSLEFMVAHVKLKDVCHGEIEELDIPLDADLRVMAGRSVHIISSPSQPYGLRLLIGDREL